MSFLIPEWPRPRQVGRTCSQVIHVKFWGSARAAETLVDNIWSMSIGGEHSSEYESV
ncbi:hypothetical protein BDZ89DRAFT_1073283 [Hymenopellis radicata]|nr:hypothetical protein BDZ89DRAFT_1073283 [Hymenopellis radicata]